MKNIVEMSKDRRLITRELNRAQKFLFYIFYISKFGANLLICAKLDISRFGDVRPSDRLVGGHDIF